VKKSLTNKLFVEKPKVRLFKGTRCKLLSVISVFAVLFIFKFSESYLLGQVSIN
jgi:hypothetical protein